MIGPRGGGYGVPFRLALSPAWFHPVHPHNTHQNPLNACKCLQDCKRIPTTTHYKACFLLPIEQGATPTHNFFLLGYNFFLWVHTVHLSLLEYCTTIDLQQLKPCSSISLINNSVKNLLKHLLKFSFVCVLL